MEDTLKKLTEKILAEGIEKANAEADKILEKAKKHANDIMNEANLKAAQTIEQAQREADEYKRKLSTEMELTTKQSLNSIKQSITDVLLNNAIDKAVDTSFNDVNFVKDMLLTMFKNWDIDNETTEFEVLYPEQTKLNDFLQQEIQSILKNKITFVPSKNVDNGFVIEQLNSSYKVSFTEENFKSFIKEHLRPMTFDLLFNKKK